jgi:hypothetical protein
MARGLLIGFLAGALIAGLVFKLLASREDGAAPASGSRDAPDGATSPGGGGKGEAPAEEVVRLRTENDSLAAKVRELEGKLDEAKRAATVRARPDRSAKWRELAAAIAKAKKDAEASGGPMKNDTWLGPLLALVGLVADDCGLPIGEVVMSPEWYPMFASAVLDASPFPMTPEQRRAFEEALAGPRAEWEEFVKNRDGMTLLEKAKALRDLQFQMFSNLTPVASEEQRAYIASLNLPPPNAPYQGVWNGAGTREAVKANITTNLAKSLALDGNQMASLEPVISDYMRAYDGIQKEAALRKKEGQPYDDVAAKIALAMEMQKRIGETARLTEAQAKALKDWAQVYDYQIKE